MTAALPTFDWLITDFVRSTDGVTDAVAVAVDGLLMASSQGLDRDAAERLAAIISGIANLSQGAASAYGFDGLKLIMIEMYGGFLLVTTMRDGSILGAIAEDDCEVGLVGYEMAVLADRAGDLLTPGAR